VLLRHGADPPRSTLQLLAMLIFLANKLISASATLLLVSMLIFAGTEILPGDAATAILGQAASHETLAAMRESLGLNVWAPVRYWHWLVGIASGDVGFSLANRRPIAPELWTRLENTFFLAGVTALFAVPISLAMGIAAAVWRNGWFDRIVNAVGLLAISLPEFFIAYLLVLFLAVQLDLFPSMSTIAPGMGLSERLWAIALPGLTLALAVFAYIMRMTRTAILAAMAQPFIEMAVLKGVPAWRITLFHALPTALAPIIQVVAYNLAYMVVGVVVVEVVFVYPGIGQYLVDAVSKRDVNVVQVCGLVFGATYVGINLVADVLTILVNPRLRYPR
jgi:peptide/nickel transport system permease protein